MSDKNITGPTTTDHILNPQLSYFGAKTRVEFNWSCLKQDKITYDHGKIVNIYIIYEINKKFNIGSYPALQNCLFWPVLLKILILISTDILDMVLDLIDTDFFHNLVVELVEIV